jgi:hypothetical protein
LNLFKTNKMGSVVAKQHEITEMTPCAMMLHRLGVRRVIFSFRGAIVPLEREGLNTISPYNEVARNAHSRKLSDQIANDTCNMIVALLGQNISVCIVTDYDSSENGNVYEDGGYIYDGPELVKKVLLNRFGDGIASRICTDVTETVFKLKHPQELLLVSPNERLLKRAKKKHMFTI